MEINILKWVESKVVEFCNKKGYGQITFFVEKGKITRCKMEESIKPPSECNKK